jgi:hypothetical protein
MEGEGEGCDVLWRDEEGVDGGEACASNESLTNREMTEQVCTREKHKNLCSLPVSGAHARLAFGCGCGERLFWSLKTAAKGQKRPASSWPTRLLMALMLMLLRERCCDGTKFATRSFAGKCHAA